MLEVSGLGYVLLLDPVPLFEAVGLPEPRHVVVLRVWAKPNGLEFTRFADFPKFASQENTELGGPYRTNNYTQSTVMVSVRPIKAIILTARRLKSEDTTLTCTISSASFSLRRLPLLGVGLQTKSLDEIQKLHDEISTFTAGCCLQTGTRMQLGMPRHYNAL